MASIKSDRYTLPIIDTHRYVEFNGKLPSGHAIWRFNITYRYIGSDGFWINDFDVIEFKGDYKKAEAFAKEKALSRYAFEIDLHPK